MPGSSLVLAKQLGEDWLELDCMNLEDLLLWLLQNDLNSYLMKLKGFLEILFDKISKQFLEFFEHGNGQNKLTNPWRI